MKHSYSSISCFQTCPKQFEEKYILKTVKFVQNAAAKYGSEGHDAMDKAIKSGEPPKGSWAYAEPHYRSIVKVSNGNPIESEVAFGITSDKTPETFFKGWLRGKLDVLTSPSEGRYLIADWKFAKYDPSKYNLEMDVFTYLLMMNKPDVEQVRRCLIWMKQESKGAPSVSNVSKADFAMVEDNVLGSIAKVEDALRLDKFEPKRSGLCGKYCDVISCKYNGRNK